MEQTLRQLGELLLGSVPTIILLALLYTLYAFLVHRPLMAVLAERRARTQGAMEKARADIAAADAWLCLQHHGRCYRCATVDQRVSPGASLLDAPAFKEK